MIWDVMVAGAGPAGAVAAGVLARAGRRVLMVDNVVSTRLKVKVGESLPGAARPLLSDLGVLSLLEGGPHLPSYGNASAWGSEDLITTDFIRDPHGTGWHLDRPRFDEDLRCDAQRAGVVLRPERVRSVAATEDGWWVRLTTGDIRARWLIDATGRRAFLAKSLGIHRQRDDSLVALCTWVAAPETDVDGRALIEAMPNGWWYTARLPHRLRVVVLHVDREQVASILCQPEAWLELLAQTQHLRSVVPLTSGMSRPCVMEACGGRLERFEGEGWLAVGDAALSFDPLSSQGLLNALYTGMRAGQALHAALDDAAEQVMAYGARLEQIRRAYLQHHRTFYRMEDRWPNRSFWANRQVGALSSDPAVLTHGG